jgi:hypothetical protein
MRYLHSYKRSKGDAVQPNDGPVILPKIPEPDPHRYLPTHAAFFCFFAWYGKSKTKAFLWFRFHSPFRPWLDLVPFGFDDFDGGERIESGMLR